ncbi:hypothetical protein PRUPE_2G132700 [Prunus persica]|uniref:Uncharacterized protein n=1 Tax=Prunus persica TaxID=3760 RepID=A0A251QFB3_PRUPE|nr:hypothetical protein PRUPE_2G132700 [Prunus persica]
MTNRALHLRCEKVQPFVQTIPTEQMTTWCHHWLSCHLQAQLAVKIESKSWWRRWLWTCRAEWSAKFMAFLLIIIMMMMGRAPSVRR